MLSLLWPPQMESNVEGKGEKQIIIPFTNSTARSFTSKQTNKQKRKKKKNMK